MLPLIFRTKERINPAAAKVSIVLLPVKASKIHLPPSPSIPLYPRERKPSINGASIVIIRNNPKAKMPHPVSIFLRTPISITFLEPKIHKASIIPKRMKKALPPTNIILLMSLEEGSSIIAPMLV